jgi:hypothetical protein
MTWNMAILPSHWTGALRPRARATFPRSSLAVIARACGLWLVPRRMRRRLARMGSQPGRREASAVSVTLSPDDLETMREQTKTELRRRGYDV